MLVNKLRKSGSIPFFFFASFKTCGCWILSNVFSALIAMVFLLYPIKTVEHTDSFLNTEPPQQPWNKFHSVMMYIFYVHVYDFMLLNSICWYFVDNFCLHIDKSYQSVLLFFVLSLVLVSVILLHKINEEIFHHVSLKMRLSWTYSLGLEISFLGILKLWILFP